MSENKPILWRWQYMIPFFVLLATSIWGLYVGYIQKDRKRIDFSLLSEAVIADLKTRPYKDLKLMFQNQEINNATIVSFRLINSGNVHLQPLDPKTPSDERNPRIEIIFNQNIEILSSRLTLIGRDKSSTFEELPSAQKNSTAFLIRLFNAGAEARIDIIVANYTQGGQVTTVAKGLGIKGRLVSPDRRLKLKWWQLILVLFWSALIAAIFKSPVHVIAVAVAEHASFIGVALTWFIDRSFDNINLSHRERNDQILSVSAILFISIFIAVLVITKYILDYMYTSIW